jgi:primosomal protein N' (replication factor Y)
MVKIPAATSIVTTKSTLQKILNSFEAVAAYRSIRVIVNVDFY